LAFLNICAFLIATNGGYARISARIGTYMQKQLFRPAKFSLALGFTAVFFAFSHAWMLNLIAVPLGLASILMGLICTWVIQRRRQSVRGAGFAVGSIFMGVAGIVTSVMVMANMATNQFDHHRQNEHLQRKMGSSSMPDESATNFTSNLPIIVLHTDGNYISKEEQTVAKAEFFGIAPATHRANIGSTPEYQGKIGLHLRGSSTLDLPKHSYTVHTLDEAGNQSKAGLLGMPPDEDWVLYAPFEDKTMIRDVLAYQLANKMGRYAPRTQYVELFLSGSRRPVSMRDYMGVYVLMEKIKRGADRVKIAKLKPEDHSEPEISGGYIIKRDHRERPEPHFRTSHGGPYFYVYPNAKQINSEQKAWLKNYLNSFEQALYGDDFKDPKAGYAGFLDVDYFIDEHWLIELSKNVDGFRYSSYITKDRGGKIQTGPPWDWNRSFGNANYYGGENTRGWYSSRLRENEISYYQRLQEDPAFMKRRAKRWHELRSDVLDPKKITAMVDGLAAQLEEAQARNFKRWPILGEHLSCNSYVGQTYDDEVRWLKKWITDRIAWIDGQVGKTD
jgi:hypothetical protein